MIHTAQDLFPGQYGEGAGQELLTQRPNVHEGFGRVNLATVVGLGASTLVVDESVGLATGASKTYDVRIKKRGKSLRATLVYTDAPAALTAKKALVNDLSLEVNAAGKGIRVVQADHINNTKMIEMDALTAGTYQVSVKAESVPQGKNGKQPYALLITVE